MGFKDIQKFNNALLVKQVWRLIHQKDTLLYKVFSAKYFPHGSIMDASVPQKCSYAWRSILQAREVIEKCAIWRVGSGHGIDVWKHRWLPNPTYNKIISPRRESSVSRVSELFYPDTRIWDPGKLEENFYPWEAEMVSRIQVSVGSVEDLLVWPLTSDGSFSVRSAYRFLASENFSSQPSSSSGIEQQNFWKKIWKIRAPNKIKHFIWRAAKDALPTKQNLRARHIPIDETCDLCEDHQETLLHSLWLCDHAQFVWKSDPGFAPLFQKRYRSFRDLLEAVMLKSSQFRVALFCTTAWSLWQRRNRLREKQPSWTLHELGSRAKAYVVDFLNANSQPSQGSSQRAQVSWSPPTESVYKGNFDAAFFDTSGCAGVGVVFRDSQGQVIAALSQKIPLVQSVELAEAMAARRALLFAKELSLFDVEIEGDCSRVLAALIMARSCSTLFGHVIDECKSLGASLRSCKFNHVRREGNRLAHALARRAIISVDTDVWVESLPSDLDNVFQSDLIQ